MPEELITIRGRISLRFDGTPKSNNEFFRRRMHQVDMGWLFNPTGHRASLFQSSLKDITVSCLETDFKIHYKSNHTHKSPTSMFLIALTLARPNRYISQARSQKEQPLRYHQPFKQILRKANHHVFASPLGTPPSRHRRALRQSQDNSHGNDASSEIGFGHL